MHIGPHNVARAERGVALERVRASIAEVEVRGDGWDCRKVRGDPKEAQGHRRALPGNHQWVGKGTSKFRAKEDQKHERWAFWWLVLVVGTVAFLGNFLREGAVRALDALGAWWGS